MVASCLRHYAKQIYAKIHSRDTHTKMCFTQISQSFVWRRMAVVKQQKQFWYLKEIITWEFRHIVSKNMSHNYSFIWPTGHHFIVTQRINVHNNKMMSPEL